MLNRSRLTLVPGYLKHSACGELEDPIGQYWAPFSTCVHAIPDEIVSSGIDSQAASQFTQRNQSLYSQAEISGAKSHPKSGLQVMRPGLDFALIPRGVRPKPLTNFFHSSFGRPDARTSRCRKSERFIFTGEAQ